MCNQGSAKNSASYVLIIISSNRIIQGEKDYFMQLASTCCEWAKRSIKQHVKILLYFLFVNKMFDILPLFNIFKITSVLLKH